MSCPSMSKQSDQAKNNSCTVYQVSSGTVLKSRLFADINFTVRDCSEKYFQFVSVLKSFPILCYCNFLDKLLYGAK